MKKIFTILFAMAMVFAYSAPTHATLILRGTDTLGYQLIYDTDLDITWYDYDYTNRDFYQNVWQNQVDWASGLTVTFGNTAYSDWRLPVSDTCIGLNGGLPVSCTGSEMGHLYYTELGNSWGGPLSTSFTDGLTGNSESFLHLPHERSWSGTEYNPLVAWYFDFYSGYQDNDPKVVPYNAVAVRPGDVAAVPEPGTMLLLGSGLFGLAAVRKRLRRIDK